MADLLLELFSEEIPARMQALALEHMQNTLKSGLKAERAQGFVTPRRLAVIVENLPATQPDISSELKGPKIDAPEAALQGFLKKSGLTLAQIEKRDGIYFANIHQKGKPTSEIIKPLIEEMLANFPWPKSMRWGSGTVSWVRPLHSILCLFDGNVVPVEFAGVKAGNITYGHRFLAPKPITITRTDTYETQLEDAKVLANALGRKTVILQQAEAYAVKHKLTLKKDDALFQEVTGLVEWPVLLMGKIDDKFIDLPKEVLVTVMRSHQKYFALEKSDGSLAPEFLITANTETKDGGKAIIAGNERVLRARFSDARFFWDQDRKKPLSSWAEGLNSVTFHAKLGTIAEKVKRVTVLAILLAGHVKGADKKLVERAANLCKADLVTGMVGEFAELQGIMGRYYAKAEDPAVADAIRDHYKPQGPGDSVPNNPVAICVALADKLDTLVSMFAIGEKPTGSKDPFALRRAALGVIRIVLENNIRLSLKSFLNDDLLAFFHDRLIVQLKDQGIRHDVIKAVVSNGDDDLVRIVARAGALQEFLVTEDGKNLLAAYKRASNILSIEIKKDKQPYNEMINFSEFKLKEEQGFKQALSHTANGIIQLLEAENFIAAMSAFSKLRDPVDTFFDKVLVNDKDEAIRRKRLCLLSELKQAFDNIANFALIEG